MGPTGEAAAGVPRLAPLAPPQVPIFFSRVSSSSQPLFLRLLFGPGGPAGFDLKRCE